MCRLPECIAGTEVGVDVAIGLRIMKSTTGARSDSITDGEHRIIENVVVRHFLAAVPMENLGRDPGPREKRQEALYWMKYRIHRPVVAGVVENEARHECGGLGRLVLILREAEMIEERGRYLLRAIRGKYCEPTRFYKRGEVTVFSIMSE